MNKKIIVLFLLLASFVMFIPEQDSAATGDKSVSAYSSAATTVQRRYRRRYRRVYYRRYRRRRGRVVYHYGIRNGRWYRVRIN